MQPQEVGVTEVLANLSIGYIVLAALVLTVLRLALVSNRTAAARSVAELIESLIIAGVLVFLIIRPFFLQAFYIPSESMERTLMGHNQGYSQTGKQYDDTIHDHIFVNKLTYRFGGPSPGDIIVFKAPKEADMEHNQTIENVLIKRLIAVGGDTVEVKQDEKGTWRVYRNNQPLTEPYINEDMTDMRMGGAQFAVNGPLKLAPDELFVMGDNRNHSNDSRFWGPLKRDRVIGKASFIFWPLGRIRLIR
jgi:signal peptidase I